MAERQAGGNVSARRLVRALAMTVIAAALPTTGFAQKTYGPGANDSEIRLGQTMPYSGPASAWGVIGRIEAEYFAMINAQGGVNGRKINLISYDDAYSPPRTVEQTRKLVESDGVLATFQGLGTATQGAVQKYLNDLKVPQILVSSGASRFADPVKFPWTTQFNPSYQTEAHIWGNYVSRNYPDSKIGVLYQNDDMGKDYLKGLHDALGSRASNIVAEAPYDISTPTVDSQVIQIKESGAGIFLNLAGPKFAAQAIKKIAALGWKPVHLLNANATGLAATIRPAGVDISKDIVAVYYLKDPDDPTWDNDLGMSRFRAFMSKYGAAYDIRNASSMYAYSAAQLMVEILKRCGDNLTRENLLKQATSFSNIELDLTYPGMFLSTSPDDHRGIKQLQMLRFDGANWVRFGSLLSDEPKSE